MTYTRRDLGKLALATLPLAYGQPKVNSKFGGVQIGAITYSFRGTNDLDAIINMMVQSGLGEAELMSTDAEAAAGAPSQGRGGPARPPNAKKTDVPDAKKPTPTPRPRGSRRPARSR